MAKLTIKNAKPYRTHAEALNALFGSNYKQHIKACKEISKTKCVVFFNLAEADSKGVWKTTRNVNWLNIPANDGSAFVQIELNKKDNSYFVNVKPPRDNAVFMWKKIKNGKYAYYFYGVFKRTCYNEAVGMSLYEQTSKELETNDWKIK